MCAPFHVVVATPSAEHRRELDTRVHRSDSSRVILISSTSDGEAVAGPLCVCACGCLPESGSEPESGSTPERPGTRGR